MKEFGYYIFIDYSENYLGYLIVEKDKLKEFIPKISKFNHYREIKCKPEYLKSIKKVIDKNRIYSYLCKVKIRKTEETPEIYSDILEFIKKHDNFVVFICIDNKQFLNFERLVKIIDGKNLKVIKESELKKDTREYKISLVLDTLLNLARLKNDKI